MPLLEGWVEVKRSGVIRRRPGHGDDGSYYFGETCKVDGYKKGGRGDESHGARGAATSALVSGGAFLAISSSTKLGVSSGTKKKNCGGGIKNNRYPNRLGVLRLVTLY